MKYVKVINYYHPRFIRYKEVWVPRENRRFTVEEWYENNSPGIIVSGQMKRGIKGLYGLDTEIVLNTESTRKAMFVVETADEPGDFSNYY